MSNKTNCSNLLSNLLSDQNSYCPDNHSPSSTRTRNGVALNANTGGVGPLPVITTLFADPLNVVSTSIDTCDLGRTGNLLHFSGIVNLPLGVILTLNFQIKRSYNNGDPIKIGGTYTFATLVNILESESFSFQFFDSEVEPGFYTYSVELSTNSIIDVTPGTTIQNAVLSVLAVSK